MRGESSRQPLFTKLPPLLLILVSCRLPHHPPHPLCPLLPSPLPPPPLHERLKNLNISKRIQSPLTILCEYNKHLAQYLIELPFAQYLRAPLMAIQLYFEYSYHQESYRDDRFGLERLKSRPRSFLSHPPLETYSLAHLLKLVIAGKRSI